VAANPAKVFWGKKMAKSGQIWSGKKRKMKSPELDQSFYDVTRR
jgi:hypothetical protein